MSERYKGLAPKDKALIEESKVFFIASCSGKEVNLSPKGYDAIRIVDDNTLLYLDWPGSSARTARDIEADGEVTVLFTSFADEPRIVRLFCKGELVEKDDPRFADLFAQFDGTDATLIRRLTLFHIRTVEKSCGESVPQMEFVAERPSLKRWSAGMVSKGKLEEYIRDHAEPPEV